MKLIIQAGPFTGQEFPLTSASTFIGCGADNQVGLLYDPAAAARHAVIYLESNCFYRNNLASQGAYINGCLATKQVLGMAIRFR